LDGCLITVHVSIGVTEPALFGGCLSAATSASATGPYENSKKDTISRLELASLFDYIFIN